MKKLLLTLFIFSIIILPAYSNNQITKDEAENIEQKYSQCIDNSSVINYPNCAYEYGENWKIEIDRYYRLLKKEMSKDDFTIIEKSQNEWEHYVNTQTKVIDRFITNQDGIICQTIGQSEISQLYKERALLLKDILHYYEENKESKSNNRTISFDDYLKADKPKREDKILKLNKDGNVIFKNKIVLTNNGEPLNDQTAYTDDELKVLFKAQGIKPRRGCDPTNTILNGTLGCFIDKPDLK